MRIDNQVNITLSVSELRIREGIKYLSILLLYYRENSQRFAQDSHLFCMHRYLSGLGNKYKTFYTDNVTYIEKFLEYSVVEGFVFSFTDLIPLYINLDFACVIHKLYECGSTHNPSAHDSSGNGNIPLLCTLLVEFCRNFCSFCIYIIKCSRVRLDTQLSHLHNSIAPVQFLLVEISLHYIYLFFIYIGITKRKNNKILKKSIFITDKISIFASYGDK